VRPPRRLCVRALWCANNIPDLIYSS
jgi:hypothetical protein